MRFPLLELDDAAEALLALPDFFLPALLSLPLGVAETNRGLDDLLPLRLRLLADTPPALLFDLDLDLEAALIDFELPCDRDEADRGESIGLLDLRDPLDDERDLDRDERLPELSIFCCWVIVSIVF